MPFKTPVGARVTENQISPTFIRPLQDKRVIVGQSVVLECQVEANPAPVIKWLKDGQNVTQCPDYVMAQEGKVNRLIIENAQVSDCGRFTIQAMNAVGNKQSTCVLIVAPAPTPVPGVGPSVASSPVPLSQTPVGGPTAPIFLKEIRHQPLRLGAAGIFEGRVVGLPPPKLEWLKAGQPLKNYRARMEYDPQTGICNLVIAQMLAEDIGEYTCVATNEFGTVQSSAHIMPMDEYEKWFGEQQAQVTRERKQKLLDKKQQASMSAAGVRRPTPPATHPSQQISAHRTTPQYILRQLQEPHTPAQMISPIAYPFSGGVTSPHSAKLETDADTWAVAPPIVTPSLASMAPVFRQHLRDLSLTEGTDVVLQCSVVGVPKPRVGWFKDGRPLDTSGRTSHRWQSHYEGTLALLKISMVRATEDSGEYTIIAENINGRAQSSARVEIFALNEQFQQQKSEQLKQRQQPQQQPFSQQQQQQPRAVVKEVKENRILDSTSEAKEGPFVAKQQQEDPRRVQQQQQQQQQQQRQEHQQLQAIQPQIRDARSVHPSTPVLQQQPQQPQTWTVEKQAAAEQQQQQYRSLAEQQRKLEELAAAAQQRQQQQQQAYQLYQQQQLQQRERQLEQLKREQQEQEQQRQREERERFLQQQQQIAYQQQQQQQQQRQLQLQEQQRKFAESQKAPEPVQQTQYEFEYLFDPSAEPKRVHPYLQPPEQVAYYLNQQAKLKQQQTMAPPPAVARKPTPTTPVQNGMAAAVANGPQKQQQQPQQQQLQKQQIVSGVKQSPKGGVPTATAASLAGTKPPQFTQMPQSIAVRAGQPAVFVAKATGQPQPQISWMNLSTGQQLTAKQGKVQIAGVAAQSQLTLLNVTQSDIGTYACVANNTGGSFQAQFTLNLVEMNGTAAVNSNATTTTTSVKSTTGGAGAPRPRFQSPTARFRSPTPEVQREQVILKKVDRSKQYGAPKRMHLDEELPAPSREAPKLSSQLNSQSVSEGQTAILECKFSPANDPNLKIAWLLNGKAVIPSSRITSSVEQGVARLEINPITVFDHGEYTLVAVNTLGEARQTAVIDVAGYRSESVTNYIQQNLTTSPDQFVPIPEPRPLAAGKDRPNFVTELRSQELFVGQPLHLETKLTPLNDPNLTLDFYLNGSPIQPDEHLQLQYKNGFIVLHVAEATEKDAGYYIFRAENELGEAETSATVLVLPNFDASIYLDGVNAVDVEDARELQNTQEQGKMHAPQIIQPPRDFYCDAELGRSYFDAKIAPVYDSSMRVAWFKDGQPIANANRIQCVNNFGFVSITIHPTYPEDAGVYTLVLNNMLGQAQASATLTTVATDPLQLEPMHEQSLARIQDIEGYQVHIGPVLSERLEEFQSMEAPRFARPLSGRVEVDENEPVHFECRIQPANDVKMVVEWFHNDAPLSAAHRFRPMFDFGYIALDLLYAYPEDSGVYKVVARNEIGSVESAIELAVRGKETLLMEAQHPEGLDRIAELEQPKDFGLQEVPDRECEGAPQFLGNLQDIELYQHEDVHFEIKLTPVNDPTMTLEWLFNDQPLYTGSRIHHQYDFGFIILSIRGVIPEDSGTYTVRATNALGQDSRSCQVSVLGADTILSATQHEESLGKIEYLENLQKFQREEIPDYEPTAPHFVEQLPGDVGEVEEGDPLHLECKVEPIGDNQLRVFWLQNGHPLGHAHRFRTFHDFGFVSLDILSVYAEDSGTYTCVAENSLGQAETSATFHCEPKNRIYSDTRHPSSVARIAEIEAPRPLPEELAEEEKSAPHFTKPLSGQIRVAESDNVYLEVQYGPTNDNTLTCEWLVNGQPLLKAHRFVLSQDFGFAALNILYIYPEDSGTYSLVIRNANGQEASSSVEIVCDPKDNLLGDTFHPQSVQRIAELEAPRPLREEPPEPERDAPQIVKQLTVSAETVAETQSLRLEAQFLPIDDNKLQLEWLLDGQPLKQSNRHRLVSDFGFAAIDINFILAEDAGEYTLVVRNEKGEARTSAAIQIEEGIVIVGDTQHPESLRRILELEAVKPAEPSEPELEPVPPQFTQQLSGQIDELNEGQPLHLECTVQPINDPNLRIEWYFNDLPLQFSSRIRTIHDFGYVALEFAHIHPEDSGTYTCRAVNAVGEATTQLSLECASKRNLYLESQHESSWQKIQEMENRQPLKEPSPELHFGPPTFIVPLSNFEELIEGDAVRLECRLQPVNDPTLKVLWTCNGNPLPEGNRFMPARNLDLVTLDIATVYGEDSGVYTCKAISDFGEAATSATVKCQATDALLLDTQHEQSWQQIQEIESRKPPEPIVPEPVLVAPNFVVQLPTGLPEFPEGSAIHIEGRIEPVDDNQLVVEWYLNGQPLANGHRFRHIHDFGYVSLDILYSFAQDSGEYVCVARNSVGEARSATTLSVGTRESLFLDPQHPDSWARIQELEAPRPVEPEAEPTPAEAPQFLGPLQSLQRVEGQSAHFETRVTPVNDNRMQIAWLKDGQPLGDSNRFRFTNDFGLVALDITYTQANDAGTYTVVASNEAGQAQVDGQLSVETVASILGDTQHAQSWARIQEIEAPRPLPEEASDVEHEAPRFVQQLNSAPDVIEGQPVHFEALVEPISDPNLKIQWFHNGRPLAASNRVAYRNDFGLVTLDIRYVLPQDIGDYRCVASNNSGEAATEGHLDVAKRPGLLLDSQHPSSWSRIQELEAPRPIEEAPELGPYAKPQFTQPLQSLADVAEGSMAVFQARVIPVNDPNLQIQWFLNDQPLGQSNRFAIHQDFGQVALHIAGVTPYDAGVFSCKAVNLEGAAITSASLSVLTDERIVTDPLHAQSYQKIQELEAMEKYPRLAYPDREFEKPVWTQTFADVEVDTEGSVVQLIGLVEPAQDPDLHIEWFLNGVPLMNANRFRQDYSFGQALLTIVHVLPHDTGVYSCRAVNAKGDATTSATVKVAGYEAILRDTQHPESWERIQELERPKIVEEVEVPDVKEKPRFLTQLESVNDVDEGTPIRLEATFQPARDNDLKVLWEFNGAPLGASQLIRTRVDLGWAALDIGAVNMDHVGVYTLKIVNTEGEAASSASVKVAGIGEILGDTKHEESWKQIQILEAPKPREPSPPPPEYPAPTFSTQIADIECDEGDASKFEASFMPNNDPYVKCQWVRNGVPLAHGSKYAISYDFGYCTLGIGYTFPEDEGLYQLVVTNSAGEAVTSATLKCHPKAAILDDTQHEESWRRIQEIEAPKPPPIEAEPAPKQAPRFTSALLTPTGELYEGQPAHFETTYEPIDDADVKVHWLLNGQPVANSSRLKQIADFGWVVLNITDTEQRDTGEWTCVATNSVGEASVSAQLAVAGRDRLLLEPINEASFSRIQEIEAPRAAPEEAAPAEYAAPAITVQLSAPSDCAEGDSAHLEAHYTPTNDPKLVVEWYKDEALLFHSNRYKMVNDFGFAILDILYALAHDAGQYSVRVVNEAGEASSSAQLDVQQGDQLLLQPVREENARAVQNLEDARARRPEEMEVAGEGKVPVFVQPLAGPSECAQGDRAHFTARYEPKDDNQLRFFWTLNNRPLITGSRVKTITEFGYVVLEIYPVYPEDSGEYICRAVNAVGEAVTAATLTCTGVENIEHQSQLPQGKQQAAQQRIHELETRRPELFEQPEIEHGPPRFVSQLPQSVPQLREGVVLHIDAQLEPAGDPQLKLEWFHDGAPVRDTNRMKLINDFGFVVLELAPAEPQDTGTWLCRATNAHGSAETQCQIEVIGDSGVSYEWVSPGERRERINELEDWINRPSAALAIPEADFGAPKFTEPLADAGQLDELAAHAFICVLEPVGDPSLRIEWQHNGHAIPYSNRIVLSNDFGVITLMIKQLITQDTGEYRCIARNAKGEAQTSATITVESIVQVDTPAVSHPLVQSIEAVEGEPIHLECRVTPINDPKLRVEWLRNGHSLGDANRFVQNFEFGFVTLEILYALPEDSGDYELRAVNDKGEAVTRTQISVAAKPSLVFSPQVPGANIVDNLEHHLRQFTRAQLELTAEDSYQPGAQQAPVFKTQLNNVGVEEGDFCRFETQLAPVNDPYMKVDWYRDGKPVLIGTRFRNTLDYGYACLDLLYALPDDTGEYTAVAVNQFGEARLSAKLACSSKKHILTESQIPQGQRVRELSKNVHWTDKAGPLPPRQKQKPAFTILPRNIQVNENEPARFECAVEGYPRPKIVWYLNGQQALAGHRFQLRYDGVHYLTIPHTRIADAGTIEAIAHNSEGDAQATASLDVFQHEDFRQHRLRGSQLGPTGDEISARQQQWQRDTLGTLGEAFERAPKGDATKLLKVEQIRAPIEPLESEELVQKFTRAKDEQFYDKLAYVERPQRDFPGLELEPVGLKPGKIEPYKPPREKLETVPLRNIPEKEGQREVSPAPDWAAPGGVKLGEPVGRYTQLPEPEQEPSIPARDQVRFRTAKPKPATQAPPTDHVTIDEQKARVVEPRQGPVIEQEPFVPHAQQVQMRQKFQPKVVKPLEPTPIEPEQPLKDIPPVVKEGFESVSVPSKPQPTKPVQTAKKAPAISSALAPAQAEIGRAAAFSIAYTGDEPVMVKWFFNGRQIRSAFDTQIKSAPGESRLEMNKLKANQAGEYSVVLENVGGRVESKANLQVNPATSKGIAPEIKQRIADSRAQQGGNVAFNCSISGTPKPTIQWFKDGKPLPNDERFQPVESEGTATLNIVGVLPTDAGIYECVVKNPAGETRCKARLNVILAKTGTGTEAGPKLIAPRFTDQIKPILGTEGGNAEFRAKYSGDPEPTIRWTRNNEPIKPSQRLESGYANGEAWLKFSDLRQEDVADYKCEAVNPAGKASTVANLVLKPASGRVIGGKPGTFVQQSSTDASVFGGTGKPVPGPGKQQQLAAGKAPQFLQKLTPISARPGENVKFISEFDGTPAPSVQWMFNGRVIVGTRDQKVTATETKATLELLKVTPASSGSYSCILRNASGAAQSEAKLNVQSR